MRYIGQFPDQVKAQNIPFLDQLQPNSKSVLITKFGVDSSPTKHQKLHEICVTPKVTPNLVSDQKIHQI